jgi:hypothetical protein
MEWSAGQNEGNPATRPTRSIKINNLIKQVKKEEVQKQGVALQTRRPMTERKFRLLHKILWDQKDSPISQYGMSAMINFQFHVIGRIDDTTQVLVNHIHVHAWFISELFKDEIELVQKCWGRMQCPLENCFRINGHQHIVS